MNTSVYSEIFSKKLDQRFDITVFEMKNMQILSSVPLRKDEEVIFSTEEDLSISYFFGHFKYSFDVKFDHVVSNEKGKLYSYKILHADIDNNYRKEPRKNVEYRAIYWTSEGINFATILDISDSGMRVRANKPFPGTQVEFYYNERDSKGTKKVKGEVVWSKKLDDIYEYGIKLN